MKTWHDESILIANCKRELPHNHASFEILVQRYTDMVFTLCYRIVGNSSDAEDLLQEVFTKVFLSLRDFEERSKFSSWVYRIAHNHCLNFLNRKVRENEITSDYSAEQKRIASMSDLSSVSEKTQYALNLIDAEKRSIIVMRFAMDLSMAEISEALDLSLGAAKMRLKRAKEAFRESYQNEDEQRT